MTAVEWLEEQYTKQITFLHIEDFEQAKEMEKEQIIDAFNYGQFDLGMEAEQYYNETFKSE